MANWLDKYDGGGELDPFGLTTIKKDATTYVPPPKQLTKKQLEESRARGKQISENTKKAEAKEVQDRRNRIAVANAVKPYQFQSLKNFAVANSAIGDELRVSEEPNVFDDYLNFPSFIGHLASGLGQVPLNIQQGDYKEAAMNVAAPVAAGAAEAVLSPIIGKATTAGKKAIKKGIDQTFTKTGKELARIEAEGIAKGLSPHEIKMQQMDKVGITSAQREGYTPGLSELAYKYITPYGYSNLGNSKLSDIITNIRIGGVYHEGVGKSRNDAWRMYLGMPQQHGTFEMAQTAPIQHVAYTPKQLEGLEIFSMKKDPEIHFPTVDTEGNPRPFDYDRWFQGTDYLNNNAVVNSGHEIMGGYNQRLTKAGLEYNDVWDLNPPITPYYYLPKPLRKLFDENPLFFKEERGVLTPKEITIPVDKFLGKPFMSHGVNQNITSTQLVDKMKKAAIREIAVGAPEKYKKHLSWLNDDAAGLTNAELGEDFRLAIKQFNSNLNTAKEKLKSLEGYPKFKDGGEANYNDYSVTVPPNYEGEGYFNEGRNYSPAWGGQFQNGGNLSFIDNPKLRNMLEGYKPGFMDTVGDYRLPEGYMAGSIYPSTEVSTSIGGEGGEPAYLIPSFKYGQPLNDPIDEFNMTGQHLGGPFKTWQDAEKFQELRHQYVEKGQTLPSPIATSNMAMGGSIGGATQGIPGATGFMYARDSGSVPSKDKYAKKNIKTVASAQNGKKVVKEIPKVTSTKFLTPERKDDEEITKPEPPLEDIETTLPNPSTAKQDKEDEESWKKVEAEMEDNKKQREEAEKRQAVADWLSQQAAAQRKQEEEDRAYRSLEGVSGRVVKDLEKQLNASTNKYNSIYDYSLNKYHNAYDEARFASINESDILASKKKIADYINSPLYAKRQDYNPEQYYGEVADIQGIDERDFQNDIARQKREARLTNLANSAFEITKERSDYYKPASNSLSFSRTNDSAVIGHELGHNVTSDPYAKTPDGFVIHDDKGPMLKEGYDKYSDIYNSKSWDVTKTTPKEDIKWGYGYTGYGLNKAEVDKFVDFANPTYGQEDDPHYDKSIANKQKFAGEQYGDLMALRELMHKYGITNTFGEDIDKGKVDKALKNKNITTHPSFKRFYQRYGPNGIIQLNNTIAANNMQQGAPMAQNGMEMKFYQDGLDFKPKSISKNGKKVIKDDRGQWAHPGEITEIGSNQITMKGVPYPVLGISDLGDTQMMYPNEEYQFIGDSVTEYPMMKQGGQLTKLDQLTNFTNYNTKQPGGWLDKYQ